MPKKPLPEKVVKEMHRFRKDGHTLKDIGEAFGMKIRGKGYSAQHIKKLFEKLVGLFPVGEGSGLFE